MKNLTVAVLIIVLTSFANGQSMKLAGTVFDPNGAIVVDVYVKAISFDDKKLSRTKSAGDGTFEFELAPGTYRLEFVRFGFKTKILDEFVIDSTSVTKNFDIIMMPAEDIEPCGYGGHCLSGEEIKIEKPILLDKITPRPIIEGPKKKQNLKRQRKVSRQEE